MIKIIIKWGFGVENLCETMIKWSFENLKMLANKENLAQKVAKIATKRGF